jgi:pimeloyl-ACP methyl ester carboxylesterase
LKKSTPPAGYFRSGLPYNRVGHGPRPLVIIQGLMFENKPLPASMNWVYSMYYRYLAEDYTTYIVLRRPGLPQGYSMQDMADDYAVMIREEFGEPVDVIGVSTGGSIAHHIAAGHPDLVRKLVIHSAAYTLSDVAQKGMLQVGELARQHKWVAAYAVMFSPAPFPRAVTWIGSFLAALFGSPRDPSDLLVTIEAEDKFNFKNRLANITAPTLVIAEDQDPYYSDTLFRQTAEGIPNARLILYKGMGHPAGGEQFRNDILAFLLDLPFAQP